MFLFISLISLIICSVDISGVSCGPEHVVVVSGEGDVYSWGCGANGRLGVGDEADKYVNSLIYIYFHWHL